MASENPFEDPQVAREWISVVETDKNGSRENELFPLLSSWLDLTKPKTLVEIGCGQGAASKHVKDSVRNYIGIDSSPALIDRAQDLFKEKNKQFIVGSAYDLPVKTGSADCVFSLGVLFHLKYLDLAHKEMSRVLVNGGKFLIITANPSLYNEWARLFKDTHKKENYIEGTMEMRTGVLSRNTLYMHTLEEITASLSLNTLEVDSIVNLGLGVQGTRNERYWTSLAGYKK